MTTLRIAAAAALLMLACGSPAAATDCQEVSGNVLAAVDCGFARGIDGWSGNESTEISWQDDDGEPGPGSLAARGGEIRLLTAQGPCFGVQAATSYELVGHLKNVGEETGSCSIAVTEFSDPACSADEDFLGGALLALILDDWESTTTGSVETGDAARSARLSLECVGGPELAIRLDNLVMRPE